MPPFPITTARALRLLLAIAGLAAATADAQTYAPPAAGDFGGATSGSVGVTTFTNPDYPTANGATLTVSIFHPGTTLDTALPTIFFAHGFPTGVGNPSDYSVMLDHLAARGYNVVFSPYEGGASLNNAKRFDEMTSGFDAAVAQFQLNTAQIGFVGHSNGGGFLPSVIRHEMMGQASAFGNGHTWGASAAFMFSMAPAFALGGGGDTGVFATRAIDFPDHLHVVQQVFADDTSITDPRLALDIFTNIDTPAAQKDFLIVHGDTYGTPDQTASHFLPNTPAGGDASSLQAWAILRHLDALAAFTFTGDATARQIALGDGIAAQTNMGLWSDGTPVTPIISTDTPDPNAFSDGPYSADWTSPANPRGAYALVPEPSVTGLLLGAAFLVLRRRRTATWVPRERPSLLPPSASAD